MQVMSLNITTNLQPKMDYFVGDLQIPRKSLGRIVGAFPQVLLLYCCFAAALLLLYGFFTAKSLGRIVGAFPQVLLYCCFLLHYCSAAACQVVWRDGGRHLQHCGLVDCARD